MPWTIEAKVQPFAGFAGHLYLDIFDDAGKRVVQINGFSFCDKTKKITPIGTPQDKLKAYVTNKVVLAETSGLDRDHQPYGGHVIFSGTKEEVLEVIDRLKELAEEFNSKNFLYRVFSFNSNTVFSAMVHKISQIVPVDMEAVDKTIALKKITPGVKRKLMRNKTSLTEVFNKGKKSRGTKPKPPKPSL
jgi:uncharacterized protein YqgV (UPF0045/DUF77 family)